MNIIPSGNNIPTYFQNSKYIIHVHKEIFKFHIKAKS